MELAMATKKPGIGEDAAEPFDPSEESPTGTSKPIGDAIPAPVEPGLNQPLPEKGKTPAKDQPAKSAARLLTPRIPTLPTPLTPLTTLPAPRIRQVNRTLRKVCRRRVPPTLRCVHSSGTGRVPVLPDL
jgi:hypothetical protein